MALSDAQASCKNRTNEPMPHLAHIVFTVRDYDEALAYYVAKLGFKLIDDIDQPEQDKRWVTITRPAHQTSQADGAIR